MVALEYFTMNEWTFRDSNQLGLATSLSRSEQEIFTTDVQRIHWPTYLETYILGVRKFLLKEDPSTLPLARKRLERFVPLSVFRCGHLSKLYLISSSISFRIYYIILMMKLSVVFGSIHQAWYHYNTIKVLWKALAVPLLKSTKLPLTKNL